MKHKTPYSATNTHTHSHMQIKMNIRRINNFAAPVHLWALDRVLCRMWKYIYHFAAGKLLKIMYICE